MGDHRKATKLLEKTISARQACTLSGALRTASGRGGGGGGGREWEQACIQIQTKGPGFEEQRLRI